MAYQNQDLTDTNWNIIVEDFENKLAGIVIPLDITPGSAKPLLAKLDALYTSVMLLYSRIKSDDENVSQLLSLTSKLAAADGANAEKRVAKGIKAAQEYDLDGVPVDLFQLKKVTGERLLYINSFIKILEGKQSRMITTSGLMKIESNF